MKLKIVNHTNAVVSVDATDDGTRIVTIAPNDDAGDSRHSLVMMKSLIADEVSRPGSDCNRALRSAFGRPRPGSQRI